jgi:hypothetical protein
MRYLYIIGTVFIFLVCCCERDGSVAELSAYDVSYGDCKPVSLKSESTDQENAEKIEYRIGPMDYGQYHIVIGDYSFIHFPVSFHRSTHGVYDVDWASGQLQSQDIL